METKFAFAQELIRKAGKLILSEMDCKLRIEEKSQFDDLVTNLDQKAQDFLVTSIQERYPDDHFLAEEDEVRHPIGDGKVWVLDPIDGTVNFIVQGQQFAVMIAYYEDGQGRFGLIYDVMNDMLYSGGGQFDVYANEQRLPVYINQPFNRSLIASNATMYAENYYGIRDLAKQTLGVRVYGGAGISMTQVMLGHIMAYFSYLYPWDYAAAAIMGEKLGYLLMTLDGKQPDFKQRQEIMFVPKDKLSEIQHYVKS